jgi:hypothetical protein
MELVTRRNFLPKTAENQPFCVSFSTEFPRNLRRYEAVGEGGGGPGAGADPESHGGVSGFHGLTVEGEIVVD